MGSSAGKTHQIGPQKNQMCIEAGTVEVMLRGNICKGLIEMAQLMFNSLFQLLCLVVRVIQRIYYGAFR